MKINIRLLYLYLFSFVGLLIVIIGSINMINLGLKTLVFKEADKYEIYPMARIEGESKPVMSSEEEQERQDREVKRQRQREFSNAIAMLLVGAPVYLYHWNTIKKESTTLEKEA